MQCAGEISDLDNAKDAAPGIADYRGATLVLHSFNNAMVELSMNCRTSNSKTRRSGCLAQIVCPAVRHLPAVSSTHICRLVHLNPTIALSSSSFTTGTTAGSRTLG